MLRTENRSGVEEEGEELTAEKSCEEVMELLCILVLVVRCTTVCVRTDRKVHSRGCVLLCISYI